MENWNYNRIEQLPIQIIDGDRGVNYPKQTDFQSEGYCLFLNTGNVTKEGFDFSSLYFISKQKDEQLRKGKLQRNDIVITTRGTIGNVGYYSDNIKFQNVRINSGMIILRVDERVLYSRFLYQLFKSSFTKAQYELYSSGTAQPQLPIQDFRKIEILIPPLPTQKRIASILSAYDELIEVNKQRIKLMEETSRELYKEWFVRMRFPKYKQVKFVKGIPEGWEVVRIDTLYKTSSGGTPSREKSEYYQNGVYNWIKTGELDDGFIFETSEKITELGLKNSSAKLFPPYTTIFAMYGNTIGQLGITTQVAATNQACCALLPLTKEYDFEFLFLTLLLNRQEIISFGMGAAQQNVSQDELKKYKILKPSPELALKFKEIINPFFKQIEIIQIQNTQLRQIRDRLLPRLISGKLEVKIN